MISIALYNYCIPVRGASNSVICDFHRKSIFYIPNFLYEILTLHNDKSLEEIKQIFSSTNHKLDDALQFLIKKEIAFLTNDLDSFSKMDTSWHSPKVISHAIIDYDSYSNYSLETTLRKLFDIRCEHIQFRFFSKIDFEFLISLLLLVKNEKMSFLSLEVVINFESFNDYSEEIAIITNFARVNAIYIHNSNYKGNPIGELNGKVIIHQEEHVDSKLHCGIISKEYFLLTREIYIEGQHRNTCLNEKISIDVNGEVKNCPSMIDSYGNIMNDNLTKILNNESFRKHWNITKDQIHVCKDCEFRYVCTDCRAYVEEPSDIYSKPLKCGYNPYEGRWDEWNKASKKRDILANYNLI